MEVVTIKSRAIKKEIPIPTHEKTRKQVTTCLCDVYQKQEFLRKKPKKTSVPEETKVDLVCIIV